MTKTESKQSKPQAFRKVHRVNVISYCRRHKAAPALAEALRETVPLLRWHATHASRLMADKAERVLRDAGVEV